MNNLYLISKETNPVYHAKVAQGGFLAAMLRAGQSFAVELTPSEIAQVANEKITAFLAAVNAIANDNSFELKLIANVPTDNLEKAFGAQGKVFARVVPVHGAFEVAFFPEKGLLKLATAEAAAKASSVAGSNAAASANSNANASSTDSRVRVLMIDDSSTIRMFLRKMFAADPAIEVVGECANPLEAAAMIEKTKPNVVTLDIHMPEMDGVTLLKQLLPKYKLPFVMVTSVSLEDGNHVIEALEEGAVDYIQKPSSHDLLSLGPVIIEKVKAATKAHVKKEKAKGTLPKSSVLTGEALDIHRLIAIGSSTGGVEALKVVLTALPKDIPPIVITQHIPAVFSRTFAERMNTLCPFEVKEAAQGDEIKPGRVLVAPGAKQFKIKKSGGKFFAEITDEAPVNRHKPSVDVLFDSVADQFGKQAIGVILTGMGDDGARGLLRMKEIGCETIAQDQESSVVFGMPREAIKRGAALQILDINAIAGALAKLLQKKKAA